MSSYVDSEGKVRCSKCLEVIETRIKFPLLDGSHGTVERIVKCTCRCQREEKEKMDEIFRKQDIESNISKLKNLSLMDDKLKSARLETFKTTPENERLFNIAKNYVGNFAELAKKGQGIMFWGDVGTGKSYTSACIANELLSSEIPVVMTSFIKIVDRLMEFKGDEDDFLLRLSNVELLIIDDLGAERNTDFALEKVYDIIDTRYRMKKPIILTTNLSLADMKAEEDIRLKRIYDRIFEMCYPVKVVGNSWRKVEANARFVEMKQLLEK